MNSLEVKVNIWFSHMASCTSEARVLAVGLYILNLQPELSLNAIFKNVELFEKSHLQNITMVT